jgi:hypothetical protein
MENDMRLQMMDSLTRRVSSKALDTILSVATDEELAKYMAGRAQMNPGKIWDGYFKPMLNALDKATRDKILKQFDDYGNELGKSKAESETEAKGLAFGGENQDDEEGQPQNQLEEQVEDDEERRQMEGNGSTSPRSKVGDEMRRWRGQDHDRIVDMQRQNQEFWKRK